MGKIDSTFGCIKRARQLSCVKTTRLAALQAIYIPDGIIYESYWSGNPEIEFLHHKLPFLP
ncbi:MAG: hypothetical protein L6V93_20930 [Clostridiales bacterium]|nr:MAG: hypothetical protein L6V93_20930 [Clostridiales bacterium]